MGSTLTRRQVLKFLKQEHVASLATVTQDNRPWAAAVFYATAADFSIFFMARTGSRKVQNLEHNPAVAMCIWKSGGLLVQLEGRAVLVRATKKRDQILDQLAARTQREKNMWPPILRITGGEYLVFQVRPKRIMAMDLSARSINQARSPFTELRF